MKTLCESILDIDDDDLSVATVGWYLKEYINSIYWFGPGISPCKLKSIDII